MLTTASFAQRISIKGTVRDSATAEPIAFAIITVTPVGAPYQFVGHTSADSTGAYSLKADFLPGTAYALNASSLGYGRTVQPLLIDPASPSRAITIDIALPLIVDELATAVVRSRPPILVSGDTTIYDIPHFAESRDRTLEDVLGHIPGIRINGDGSIQVNGQQVDKVLINGKQVADAGTALLTRSLGATTVAQVEVRFDDQDAHLKESLLDADRLVVLDITLKGDVKQALFGRAVATAGHGEQRGVVVGANVNAFSLNERLNVHAFGESDQLGKRTITLLDIDNIGREAWAAMMSLPADFAVLSRRSGFSQDLYGFRDYVDSEYHVGGAGARYALSEHTHLFLGTYNAIEDVRTARTTTQRFLGDGRGEFGFSESERFRDRSTKNKLELTHTRNAWKVNADANVVAFRQNSTNVLASTQATTYTDRPRHRSYYLNGLLEYAPTPKAGAHLRIGYADERTRHARRLDHLSPGFVEGFSEVLSVDADAYAQTLDYRSRTWQSDGYGQVDTKAGTIRGGLRMGYGNVDVTRLGSASADEESIDVSILTTEPMVRARRSITPYLGYRITVGGVDLSVNGGRTAVRYPTLTGDAETVGAWEFDAAASGGLGPVELSGKLRRGLAAFPLYQTVPGLDVLGVQSLAGPGEAMLRPQFESVAEADATLMWREARVEFDAAVLVGRTRNTPEVSTAASPVFVERYAQLPARYAAVSTSVIKRFKSVPLTLTFVPEWITNSQETSAPGEAPYVVRTDRLLLGLRAHTNYREAWINLGSEVKYSDFRFRVDGAESPESRQQFVSLNVAPRFDLLGHRLFFDPRARYVRFFNTGSRDNVILDANLRVPGKRFSFEVEAGNLLGVDRFIQRALTPALLSLEERAVFGRFVRAEVTYKF